MAGPEQFADLLAALPAFGLPESAPREVREWYSGVQVEAQRRARERAARVLKYDDLAALIGRVTGLPDPRKWNGYVPPRIGQRGGSEAVHSPAGRANLKKRVSVSEAISESPYRAVLVAICTEAWVRDVAAGLVTDADRDPDILDGRPFPLPGKTAPARDVFAGQDIARLEPGAPPETDPGPDEPAGEADPQLDEQQREVQGTFMRGPGRQQ